ncbi:hypothetical protein RIF29_14712 [Crotalaria pallida]|uniref:TF-B3 domain-containing protein n=1 Tax=Crotalaria pallida TaxID=3830 RepID=A0AAN9ICZ5_CROPI
MSVLRQPPDTLKLLKLTADPIPFDVIRNVIIYNGKQATLRFENKSWPVKVLYYPHYSSAKFSVGWLDFVRDCDLKKGDACHFKIIDEDNLVFQVSISRGNQ